MSLEVGLAPVKEHDLIYIKFTDDFQSFIDISLITLVIYGSTEVYYALFQPKNEINLSILWLLTVLIYGLMTLSKITLNYMRSDEGSLCIIFAGLSFIVSLLLQLGDKKLFDLDLKSVYSNLTQNFNDLFDNYTKQFKNEDSNASVTATTTQSTYHNHLLYSCLLALLSGYIGALFVFPSLRLAKLHLLCMKYSAESRLKKAALYINFLFPLFISILWFQIAPQENDNTKKASKFAHYLFHSSSLKFFLIILFFITRTVFYRTYAQTYLNTAYEQAIILRKRTMKLTNVQFQSTIISIYKYYGVVANQYMIPMFMLLFLTLMMKTLGDLTWCDFDVCERFNQNIISYLQYYSIVSNDTDQQSARQSFQIFKQFEINTFNATNASYISFRNVFTSAILRSLIGYLTFWTCFTSFMVSCIGLLYYQYMDRSAVQE